MGGGRRGEEEEEETILQPSSLTFDSYIFLSSLLTLSCFPKGGGDIVVLFGLRIPETFSAHFDWL